LIAVSRVRRKLRAIVRKGPSTFRNVVYSWLGIWPVSSLDGADLERIPTYCISLRGATRKRDLVERQARVLGIRRFEFVDAVDARDIDRGRLAAEGKLDDDASRRHHGRLLSTNEIACSLSHGRTYELIARRDHEFALIIEDDALFVSRRLRDFRFSDVPADFDCVFLNAFLSREPPADHRRGMIYGDASYAGSSAAYVVSRSGVRKLVASYLPVFHAADGLLGRNLGSADGAHESFRREGARTELRAYLCHPDCVLNGSASHYHVSEVGSRFLDRPSRTTS
jgi:glycosyl transferase family 25